MIPPDRGGRGGNPHLAIFLLFSAQDRSSRQCQGFLFPPLRHHVPYLSRRSITPPVRLDRHVIRLQIAPTPLTGCMRHAAGTVQHPSCRKVFRQRHQVRPVAIRTRSRQISGETFRAFDTMTNTRHGGTQISDFSKLISITLHPQRSD